MWTFKKKKYEDSLGYLRWFVHAMLFGDSIYLANGKYHGDGIVKRLDDLQRQVDELRNERTIFVDMAKITTKKPSTPDLSDIIKKSNKSVTKPKRKGK